MKETESITKVSQLKSKLYGARCWVGLVLISQRKLWMGQGDAITVVRATKHAVLLILHFHVFYFHSSSTSFLLELVEKISFNEKYLHFLFEFKLLLLLASSAVD